MKGVWLQHLIEPAWSAWSDPVSFAQRQQLDATCYLSQLLTTNQVLEQTIATRLAQLAALLQLASGWPLAFPSPDRLWRYALVPWKIPSPKSPFPQCVPSVAPTARPTVTTNLQVNKSATTSNPARFPPDRLRFVVSQPSVPPNLELLHAATSRQEPRSLLNCFRDAAKYSLRQFQN